MRSKVQEGTTYWCWNWLQGKWELLYYVWQNNRWDRKISENQQIYFTKELAIKEKPKLNPFEAIQMVQAAGLNIQNAEK